MTENSNSYQSFSSANFDPNQLAQQTASVIQFVCILDVSPSISSFQAQMNKATNEIFMQELKNSHRKDDILVKCITFCEKVKHKSGYQPILNLTDDYLEIHAQGGGTALYDATLQGLETAIDYRKDLEAQGIDVRTAIFIVTDGEDNSSQSLSAAKITQIAEDLRSNEAWINSFTITMLGVGDSSGFERACFKMGLDPKKCLVSTTDSAKEIREVFGVVSKSVSSSSASSPITF